MARFIPKCQWGGGASQTSQSGLGAWAVQESTSGRFTTKPAAAHCACSPHARVETTLSEERILVSLYVYLVYTPFICVRSEPSEVPCMIKRIQAFNLAPCKSSRALSNSEYRASVIQVQHACMHLSGMGEYPKYKMCGACSESRCVSVQDCFLVRVEVEATRDFLC